MQGSAGIFKGFRTLTSTKKHAYGQAYDDRVLRFKNPANGVMTSFSVTFFFAISPEDKHKGSHGMAFVISPTRGITGASADQYLGIFNESNNGNSSNHVIAVELDTNKDDEFGDINDNHVGININGMKSIVSAPAGYYDQEGQFKNLSLICGKLLRVTILYSEKRKQLNVTLSSPEEDYYPNQPLLSLNQDLSPIFLEKMYAGFSASTGSVGAMHYMWIWFINPYIIVPSLSFGIPTFPPYPKVKSLVNRIVWVSILALAIFVAFAASALSFIFYRRHKMVKEVLEEWEIQCGPHRFAYKELFKATKGFKQLLGKGGFGQVFKGTLPGSEANIAVKRVSHNSSQGMREFLAEIATTGTDVYAFGLFMLEVSCGRRLIEPRAAANEMVLVEWTLDRWENGDILEVANERFRQEHNREQLELVLKLGVLCAHQVAAVRPEMSKVVRILNGDSQLPSNLLEIVLAERVRMWSETFNVVPSQESNRTLTFTEPFTSHGR